MVEVVIVTLYVQNSTNASEHHPMVIVRFPVQSGAIIRAAAINHVVIQVPNLHADRQAALRLVRIVRIGYGHREHISVHRHHRAVLQPGIQESDVIAVPGLFHLVLVQERDTPCAVMEDGCPLATIRYVYGTLVAGL